MDEDVSACLDKRPLVAALLTAQAESFQAMPAKKTRMPGQGCSSVPKRPDMTERHNK